MTSHSTSASCLQSTSSLPIAKLQDQFRFFPTILFSQPTIPRSPDTTRCPNHFTMFLPPITLYDAKPHSLRNQLLKLLLAGPIRSYAMRLQSSAIVHHAISLLSALCWAPCSLVLPSLVGYSSGMHIAQLGQLQSGVQVCRVSPQSDQCSTCDRCRCKPAHRDTETRKQSSQQKEGSQHQSVHWYVMQM